MESVLLCSLGWSLEFMIFLPWSLQCWDYEAKWPLMSCLSIWHPTQFLETVLPFKSNLWNEYGGNYLQVIPLEAWNLHFLITNDGPLMGTIPWIPWKGWCVPWWDMMDTLRAHSECTHLQGLPFTALAALPTCDTEGLTLLNSSRSPDPIVFTQLTPIDDDLRTSESSCLLSDSLDVTLVSGIGRLKGLVSFGLFASGRIRRCPCCSVLARSRRKA